MSNCRVIRVSGNFYLLDRSFYRRTFRGKWSRAWNPLPRSDQEQRPILSQTLSRARFVSGALLDFAVISVYLLIQFLFYVTLSASS